MGYYNNIQGVGLAPLALLLLYYYNYYCQAHFCSVGATINNSLCSLFVQDNYGIDWEGPIPESSLGDSETVEVPETSCPMSTRDLECMQCIYSNEVILASDSHADVYVNVKHYVSSRVL